MHIAGIHHAQVTIPTGEEAAARAFYCGVLGLREVPKPEALAGRGGFWLQAGALQVHIGTEDGVDRRATKAHLAYAVDDLAAWRAHLAAHSVEIAESIQFPGFVRFECRDPFGNRLEFIQPVTDEGGGGAG